MHHHRSTAAALLCCLLPLLARHAACEEADGVLQGAVLSPGMGSIVVRLNTADGREMTALSEADGTFTFRGVPPGSHLLQPSATDYFFPEVRVETSRRGLERAHLLIPPQQAIPMPLPLVLKPIGELQYFEKRKPVDLWGFIKSPYGLMLVVSLFFIFVIPRMKVDPEELKEMRAQLRGGATATAGGQQARIATRS